jgi:protein tyrosine phosphatase
MFSRYFVVLFFSLSFLFAPIFSSDLKEPFKKVENDFSLFPREEQSWVENQETKLSYLPYFEIKELKGTFHHVGKLANTIKKPQTCAQLPENKSKNRCSILPFDENRVGREISGFYYNGSDVVTPHQRYTIVQAPKNYTLEDFWYALILKRSPLVVTLCMPREYNSERCFPYWEKSNLPLVVKGWKIEREGDDESIYLIGVDSRIVKRKFHLTSDKGEEHTITQIHYENWPDNSPADPDLFDLLLHEIDAQKIPEDSSITVHCSAGIGRAGTFVLTHSLRKNILFAIQNGEVAANISVNVPKMLLCLRLQRPGLLATSSQFQSVYLALGRIAK